VRIDDELLSALDAIADHRDVERSDLVRRMLTGTLQARQRACPVTHETGKRCGMCGLLVDVTDADMAV
jgi:metal-responsive CopG/Arc/MetJ family transcriptional regulator